MDAIRFTPHNRQSPTLFWVLGWVANRRVIVPPGAHSLTGDVAGRTWEGNIWTQLSSVTTTQPFLTVDLWGKAVQLLRIQGTRVLAPSPRLIPHPPRTALNLGERSPILGTEISRTPIWALSSHTTPHRARRPWGRGDVTLQRPQPPLWNKGGYPGAWNSLPKQLGTLKQEVWPSGSCQGKEREFWAGLECPRGVGEA